MLSQQTISKLKRYFQSQKNVLAIYLYGSFAAGQTTKLSDIDFGIVLQKPVSGSRTFNLRLKYMREIYDLLRGSGLSFDYVDAVILNAVSPLLKQQVVSTGKLLFSRDDDARADFEFSAISEYENTKHLRETYMKYMIESIKKGTFGTIPKLRREYEKNRFNKTNYRRKVAEIR